MNENENTTYQILWDAIEIVPGRKFIAVNVYIKKKKKELKSIT